MVKVTFEQDGAPDSVESGKFVLAVIGEDTEKNLLCAYGKTSDTALMQAVIAFVKGVVGSAIDLDNQTRVYKALRALADTEIKRLEAKETPEAATSEESGK